MKQRKSKLKFISSTVICIFFYLYSLVDLYALDLSKPEKEEIYTVASSYAALITRYSYIKNQENPDELVSQIEKLFIGSTEFQSLSHACDLFSNEGILSCADYLNCIEDKYNHKIAVDFGKPYLISCTENIAGRFTAYISMEKSLKYGDYKPKTVEIIIAIAVSNENAKIISIFFPKEYTKLGNCTMNGKESIEESIYVQYISSAEKFYKSGDFINAKTMYENAFLYHNDSKISDKIEFCSNQINLQSYWTEVNKNMDNSNFNRAMLILEKIEKLYPLEIEKIKLKKKECLIGIENQDFNKYQQLGDEFVQKQYFEQAIEAYNNCLKIKPQDSAIKKKINDAILSDSGAIDKAIKNAIYLAESKGKLAECFKIFYSLEISKKLKGENYYFMAMMMDGRDDHVDKFMGFSKNMCDHLAVIYCKEAMKLGNHDAKLMWQDIFTKLDKL
jgi:tetratricopeptide (TPR) repeat protein